MLTKKKLLNDLREYEEKIKSVIEFQKLYENCRDDYETGFYNGIEFCLGIIAGKEPDFKYSERKEVEEIEKTEENKTIGRTVMSGVRKVGG
uniref:Uncharacterized protein n=1 Tax=Dulem virus 36 TaxID=3145754 RepID=A0AAU8AZG7_9CAUD